MCCLLYTLLWVQYRRDENNTQLVVEPDLSRSRVRADADQLGVGISAAARF